jgi:hypothetical protein
VSEAYATKDAEPDIDVLRQQAASYDATRDAEMDRLRAMPDNFITPDMRIALGLHESARAAAQQLNGLGASRVIDEH